MASLEGRAVCCSWSGGKDSCLALHRAVRAGAEPRALVTLFTEGGERTRSHGLHRSVIEAQAAALGVPLVTAATTWSDYEASLTELLSALQARGVECAVFGDIDIEAHRDWELRVAARSGMRGVLPLWGMARRDVLEEWWGEGFEARVVVARAGVVPARLLGRVLDRPLAGKLVEDGVDACGENGEFHTLATNGPPFRRPLEVQAGELHLRDGCWFLDHRVDAG